MSWWKHPDLVEKATAMWKRGHSASQIAEAVGHGATRNAILGKIHRLGLSVSRIPLASKPIARTQPNSKYAKPKPRVRPAWLVRAATTRKGPDLVIPVEERHGLLVVKDGKLHANDALTDKCCRWSFGDPRHADFHFCGKPIAVYGVAYCEFHAARMYAVPQPKTTTSGDASIVLPAKGSKELVN